MQGGGRSAKLFRLIARGARNATAIVDLFLLLNSGRAEVVRVYRGCLEEKGLEESSRVAWLSI